MLDGIEYWDELKDSPSQMETCFAIFANVLELDDQGEATNEKYAERRAAGDDGAPGRGWARVQLARAARRIDRGSRASLTAPLTAVYGHGRQSARAGPVYGLVVTDRTWPAVPRTRASTGPATCWWTCPVMNASA